MRRELLEQIVLSLNPRSNFSPKKAATIIEQLLRERQFEELKISEGLGIFCGKIFKALEFEYDRRKR